MTPCFFVGRGLHVLSLVVFACASGLVRGDVIINEFMAAPSDRQLEWDGTSVRLGSGLQWHHPDFNSSSWSAGNLPAGYGFAGLSTNLQTAMQNKTPSLYLRKEFTVSPSDAASAASLTLLIEVNDGFVAFINGAEVVRSNAGPVRHFIYRDQPAYNPASTPGIIEFIIGPASQYLRAGQNVLAIQALNAERPGSAANQSLYDQHLPTPEFKINAGLRIAAPPVTVTASQFDFNGATGASRTHTNTNGTPSNTSSGSPIPNGWLATAADPSSSGNWQSLNIVREESASAGFGATGGLLTTITQTGPSQIASVFAPQVVMNGAWSPGAVNATNLQNTTLRFRYKTAGNAQFAMTLAPPAQPANSIDSFPIIGAPPDPPPDFNWSTAVNGITRWTINATGGGASANVGTLRHTYWPFSSNTYRNGQFDLKEDNTEPSPAGGPNGVLRFTWVTVPTQAGSSDYWGWTQPGFAAPPEWPAGAMTMTHLSKTRFTFRYKLTAGKQIGIFFQPDQGGGYANRCDFGLLTGTGNWEVFNRTFDQGTNVATFLSFMNSHPGAPLQFVSGQGAPITTYQNGDTLLYDDLNLFYETTTPDPEGWRLYEVKLSDGSQGATGTRFTDALNAASSVSFLPAFSKLTEAPAGGQSLTIDGYEVVYTGPGSTGSVELIQLGASGGSWKYFPGLAEPSGGVFDPALLSGYTPPPGEEIDFAEPEEFVDWIELHNNGAEVADVGGWGLTDDADEPGKWRFPAGTSIPAGGHLLVLCDNREEANPPSGPAAFLHANFSLNGDGESVALYDASGALRDGLSTYPNQIAFASYGRNPANGVDLGYLGTATPGERNAGMFYAARVGAPEFFAADGTTPLLGGRYTGNQTLVLTSPTEGAIIRYTTDGSAPLETTGINYSGPITLAPPNDKTGVVIRARAFKQGLLSSGVKTHTYLINQNAALRGVPAVVFTGTAGQNFYKPAGMLAIQGGTYQTTSSGSVWVHSGPSSYNIALAQGRHAEREVHLEFHAPAGYYPPTQQPLREDIGLRLSSSPYQRPRMTLATTSTSPWGPWWAATERPSFNLFWRGDFGADELDYPLFPGYSVRKFQNLRLRAGKNDSGGDSPFITDELVRRLWIDMGHVGAKGLICSLYVNGQWKNIGNLTERIREPMMQEHYRSDAPWDVRYVSEWVNGNGTAWSGLMNALNLNLATLTNYQALRSRMDIDNFADYYLLNIYSAMWDWPENNFALARERSSGPNNIFRYLVWDAEGGFNVKSYYAKPASFNTLVSDLQNKSVEVSNIWKRLMLSPEWKLRFSDRINQHMFNRSILDDRDPDGAGAMKSHFDSRKDQLVSEASAIVGYYAGQALPTGAFTAWTNPTTGRRSYLLGTAANQNYFRNAGLWPLTEPPVFSQHGGVVPNGFALSMTSTVATAGQTATIYYTLDGADPRLEGGVLSASAQTYTGPIELNLITLVKARARNNTTSEWSALTEAEFLVEAVAASASNLVVAELMYHPPDATAAEVAAGFTNADDFEFIRLKNIGAAPVNLAGVRFSVGVTFDFTTGDVAAINPGTSVLVVRNRAAFQQRYGQQHNALIAGEFTGGLDNGGETITLLAQDNSTIRSFAYEDVAPWPLPPDGDGPSLVLSNPASNPDHADGGNWTSSAMPGGLPGGISHTTSYAMWKELIWGPARAGDAAISGPAADPDHDGLTNLGEYALGLSPRHSDAGAALPVVSFESFGGSDHLTIEFRLPSGLTDVTVTPQIASQLGNWSSGLPTLELISVSATLADGTQLWKYRDTTPAATRRFVRLHIQQP
ncbi:MAG: lamin tail domain-containing protein [Verrucomicrobiales bacterium]